MPHDPHARAMTGTPAEMDTATDRVVCLPEICETIRLPEPANFLRPNRGEAAAPIPVGDLGARDAALVALRLQRQFLKHWHRKATERHRMSEVEAQAFGIPEPDSLVVERICRQVHGDREWLGMKENQRAHAEHQVAGVLRAYHRELLR